MPLALVLRTGVAAPGAAATSGRLLPAIGLFKAGGMIFTVVSG
jgi:hypothetical protein